MGFCAEKYFLSKSQSKISVVAFFARYLPFLRVPTLASLIANACCLCAKEMVEYNNKIEIYYICHMPASHNIGTDNQSILGFSRQKL